MIESSIREWFESRGWDVFDFQRDAWRAYLDGRDGLIHSPTGSGKTMAAWLGPVVEAIREKPGPSSSRESVRVLWITPLRALATDTAKALQESVEALKLNWSVETRTGDTSTSVKARQRRKLPTALITTPESLTILLTYPETARQLRGVRCVVCDEWHELLSTKRGVQTDLALARVRALSPGVRVWGVSATLGNLDEAARAIVGPHRELPAMIRGLADKSIEVDCILPKEIERYPWAGHIGTRLVADVVDRIEAAESTLLFTNTRAQAEIWFRAILRHRPELLGRIAVHHGSLDRERRDRVERMLKGEDGGLRCVVSTSSLDLGVDFAPVDQVIQVGSPKGVARLVQRAGRSGHRPGAISRIIGVPTHAFELIEYAGVREAVKRGELESRVPIEKPLDVLVQHLVTAAMASGFDEDELKKEIRATWAFRNLTDSEWSWAMQFVRSGGEALVVYPEYARLIDIGGMMKLASRGIAQRHRMNIGTIVADDAVKVAYGSGKVLGTIEESFVSRLNVGDRFVFAGKVLQLKRLREMTAVVERAKSVRGAIPRWNGGKMPLSTQLADAVQDQLELAAKSDYSNSELVCLRPLLERQADLSMIPTQDTLLIEHTKVRGRHHVFVFPFAGRLAHEGLGAVLSLRLSRIHPRSVRAIVNDYGIELSCDSEIETDPATWQSLLNRAGLVDDLVESVNSVEFARRQFRVIARIAGLTQQGYPGQRARTRHLQASSDMFYDVFSDFDPENMLLGQAHREVLDEQLELSRLDRALERAAGLSIEIVETSSLTPLAFPLYAESLRATTVTSESWEDRVRRLAEQTDQRHLGRKRGRGTKASAS
ncbi:MAG: ligase-associated DNA damage response DEXH box helicase [Phycisphaerales bacterium]